MKIETQTLEVKVWDHHDAVVFVTQQRYEKTGEKTELGHDKYNHWKDVLTAIPVDFGYNNELDDEDKYKLVKNVADSLVALYQYDHDNYEIGVSYYINHDLFVNG
jgi:hypothetical protein